MEKKLESERLIFKSFSRLTEKEKQIVGKSWANPFNARFNAINNPYSTVEEIAKRKEPTFSLLEKSFDSFKDTNYFRVVFDKVTGEVVGTCRFGMYYSIQRVDTWDFALFNVLLKHWGKGYGVEILKSVCDFARNEGVKFLVAGASNDNFASYHAMIKSGFKYCGKDEEDDFRFKRDLSIPMPNEEEINQEWQRHIRRYIRRFGKRRFNRLNEITKLTKEMIEEIQKGGDEDILVARYYSICNAIEEFPEKSEGI